MKETNLVELERKLSEEIGTPNFLILPFLSSFTLPVWFSRC